MTGPALRRLSLLVAAALLVLLVALVARAGPYGESTATAPATTAPSALPSASGTAPELDSGAVARDEENRALAEIPALQVLTLFYVLAVLAVVAIGVYFVLWWVRDSWRFAFLRRVTPGRAGVGEDVAPALPEAIAEAQVVLEQGQAREAVVACWLLLQRAGQRAGTEVRDAETAREYAGRLAGEQLISEPPLRRLADLYREARFSDHVVDDALRSAARRELGVLQAELGSGVRL